LTFRICLLSAALVAGLGGAVLAAAGFGENLAKTAPAAKGETAPAPAPAKRDPARLAEISNGKLKIVFDKSSLALAGGIRLDTGAPLIADPAGAPAPIWRLEFAKDGGKGEHTKLDSLAPAQRGFEATSASGAAQARLAWKGLSLPGAEKSVDVTVTVDLPAGSNQSFWRIAVQSRADAWGMWETRFPVINVARPSKDPATPISLLQPYRYGVLRPDLFAAPKLEARYPYAMMHMQFQALLGDWGVYLAAHDPGCAYKNFELYPDRRARTHARFELVVDPPGRGGLCRRYEAPFPFVLGVFDGDWFDAAQEYRKWAVGQPWCAKGPLAKRKDVPDWCKQTGLVLKNGCMEYAGERPKEVKEARPLSANVAAIEKLLDAFGAPISTIWYGWYLHDAAKTAAPEGMTEINFGQLVEPVTGLPQALKALRGRGFRPFAYIQSVIYDQGKTLDEDAKAMRASAIHDINGKEILYNDKALPCWCMCHASEGWRKRLVELARRAVGPHGFQAVYLDSFGRSSGECFNPSHGHDLGGGFYRSQATREIGKRVRDAMKAIDPDAALSAESAVETHIDIVDMNLLSYCAFPNCVPLWHAVYHDYSITYGRSIGSDNLLVDGGQLFIIGAQIGRLYARDDPPSVLKPGTEAVQKYLAQLLKLRRECGDFLVLGRMLRPARLPADLPRVDKGTAVKGVSLPVILTSSWQSPDGRAAVVLLNLGGAREFVFECDLTEYGFSPGVGLGVTRRTDAGVTPAGNVTAGKFSRAERLEAQQAVVYEFAKAK